jgi:dihydrofolate synthase/folylpolyglutamate synthase
VRIAAAEERPPLRAADIDTYTSALEYLGARVNFERVSPERAGPEAFRLDRMGALLDELGNPQRDVKCVHVAGSKGKGSVVEMTASCLSACGYTTGIYTSPHLVDVRERIRIGRDMVSYPQFARLARKVADAGEAIQRKHGELTYFEMITAMALAHFAEQAVDIAVVEVGLGGRLDATNLVQPEVTAVTAIQLEHTAVLGDTLARIAREKAGIFKPGVAALTIPQAPEVLEVFGEVAGKVGAPLSVVGQDIEFSSRFEATHDMGPHTRVCLTTARSSYEHLPVPLKGEHQALNCGLALAILDRLRDRGFETPERKVADGLTATPSEGRMEVVGRTPRIVLDGAHTPDSVACLVRAIGAHLRYDSMVAVFGCAADKDVKTMLSKLAMGADKVIFTRASGNARAMEPRELQRKFAEISQKMTQVARGVPEAIEMARRAVGRDDLICITGSFYIAGEAKRLLAEQVAGRKPEPARP